MFVHAHTLYSSVRPFGVSCILGSYGVDGPEMFVIDPSGVSFVSSTIKPFLNQSNIYTNPCEFFPVFHVKTLLLHAINKGADQPAHISILISPRLFQLRAIVTPLFFILGVISKFLWSHQYLLVFGMNLVLLTIYSTV